MKVIVHDFGGYAFPMQLSRTLAARGHQVEHAYAANLETPRGPLERRDSDPETLRITPVELGEPFAKYSLLKRFRQERRYGSVLGDLIRERRADVVLSANTPLGANDRAFGAAKAVGSAFVPWIQDVLSVGIGAALKDKFHAAAYPVARYYDHLERKLWVQSALVVLIAETFRGVAHQWGVPDESVRVIENWAPLDELPVTPKANRWSAANGLQSRPCVIYSGALGLKHSPSLLLGLARAMANEIPEARLVVVSEGPGAVFLQDQQQRESLANLQVSDYLPIARLHEVYGAADVLLAVLNAKASEFSVPSKVLSYLCAQRPIVAAIPEGNRAAQIIEAAGAGVVTAPGDARAFSDAVLDLLRAPATRETMGKCGRAYAERNFDIEWIASLFEEVIAAAHVRNRAP